MLPQSFAELLLALVAGQLLWFAFRLCDRIVFSPLSDIPGPFWAGLTYWYEFYHDVVRPGNFIFKIEELHERYGPIIRITPRDVHVKDTTFLDTIYPVSTFQKRDIDYNRVRHLGLPGSTCATVDHDQHRRRKEALNPFFSLKNVMRYEPMIDRKVDKFCTHLDDDVARKTANNIADLYFALSYDITHEFCFGRESNLLDNPLIARRRRKDFLQAQKSVRLCQSVRWLQNVANILPPFFAKICIPSGVKILNRLSEESRRDVRRLFDADQKTQTTRPSVFDTIRADPLLPGNPLISGSEKSDDRLEQEGASLLLAGAHPTSNNLIFTHRQILSSQPILSKLLQELDTLPESYSLADLQRLDYLSACISEGQRLSPLASHINVSTRTTRVAHTPLIFSIPLPASSLSIPSSPENTPCPETCRKAHTHIPIPEPHTHDYFLPAGTPISTHAHTTHTDPKIFPCPSHFRPERWIGPHGFERRKYNLAFGKGARRCVGYNLANAVALKVFSRVLRHDIRLLPDSTPISGTTIKDNENLSRARKDSGVQIAYPDRSATTTGDTNAGIARNGMRRVSAVVIRTDDDGKEFAEVI